MGRTSRRYVSPAAGHTLALQTLFTASGGTRPFYDLANLGGVAFAGVGLRYRIFSGDAVRVRLDHAWARGESGLYLAAGEAF